MSGMTSHGQTAGRRSLAAIHPRELRLTERVRARVEADQGGACPLRHLELRHLEGVEREIIVMWATRRRAGSTVADAAVVVAPLHRPRRHQAFLRISRTHGKRGGAGWDVVGDPMPPAAAGGRVRIVHQQREALGTGGCAAPGERRRRVAALAAELVEDLGVGDRTDFTEGSTIANAQVFNEFGCKGGNTSPALAWSGAPAGTQSFALLMHDPDAPTGSGWWHWIVYNIPPGTA